MTIDCYPFFDRLRLPFGFGLLEEVPQVFEVTARDSIKLAALAEFFQRIRTRGIEQPVHRFRGADVSHDERFHDEARDVFCGIGGGVLSAGGYCTRRLQGEAASEDGESA